MSDYQYFALGARPSPPDERDKRYAVQSISPEQAAELPAAWTFAGYQQAIRNQGAEGTCVGFALASGVMGYHELCQPTTIRAYNRELSPRAVYQDARDIEPVPGPGSYPRAALKAAIERGIPLEEDWPYVAGAVGAERASGATSRLYNRISAYHAVPCLPFQLKAALKEYGPLLAVVKVYDGFYKPDPTTGAVTRKGEARGYHAVTIIGWDDERKAFHVRNSWGVRWGQGGCCWLPYSYSLKEAWAVTPHITEPAPPPPPVVVPWWEQVGRWIGGL